MSAPSSFGFSLEDGRGRENVDLGALRIADQGELHGMGVAVLEVVEGGGAGRDDLAVLSRGGEDLEVVLGYARAVADLQVNGAAVLAPGRIRLGYLDRGERLGDGERRV